MIEGPLHSNLTRFPQLGHSVETLVTTYVGALDEEQHIANQRLDTYLNHEPTEAVPE
ncbi:MAG: hypothetical protein ABIR32_00725 [Ilumatobacteraceae bacterium]